MAMLGEDGSATTEAAHGREAVLRPTFTTEGMVMPNRGE
jgi:hypothetical protein